MRKILLTLLMMFALGTPAFAADVNFNKASAEEILASLDTILDEKVAKAIVAYRDKNGGFKSRDDFRKVPGVTSLMFNEIDPVMEGKDLYYFEETTPAMHSY